MTIKSERASLFGAGMLLLAALVGPVAMAQSTVRLGRVVVMSGPLAAYGLAKNAGSDLVYQKVAQAGGAKGSKLEVVSLDDRYDPKATVQLTSQLLEDPTIVGLVGYVGVPTTAAVLGLAQQHAIALIGPTSGTEELRLPFKRYVFPIRASYLEEARRAVTHLAGIGITQIAVVHQSNAFGDIGRDAYLAALKQAGIAPREVISVPASGAEIQHAADRLAQLGVQAALFSGFTQPAAGIIRAARKSSNAGVAIYCLSAVDATELLTLLGTEARGVVVSQVVPVPTTPTLAVVREYQKAALEAGHSPSFYGLQGYIEAKIVTEALRRTRGPVTRASLVDALESMRDFDVGGMTVNYGPNNRDGAKFVDLTVVGGEGRLRR